MTELPVPFLHPAPSRSDPDRPTGDCRTCGLRARCISWGWMSPGGIWFENAVVLRPPGGCRGFVGRSADIESRFLDPAGTAPSHTPPLPRPPTN